MTGSNDPFARVGEALASAPAASDAHGVRHKNGEWLSVVPADAPPRKERHAQRGAPIAWWEYRDGKGHLMFYAARFEADGDKTVLLQTLWRKDGVVRWAWAHPPAPKPLYNLQGLASSPGATVLLVEGEKTAEAAKKLFPSRVVVTWPGGSNGDGNVDWSALSGRRVTIIPDNDDAGRKVSARIRNRVIDAGAVSAVVVTLPSILPEKWDVADPWPAGFGMADLHAAIEAAETTQPSDTIWPKGFKCDSSGLWWQAPARAENEGPPAASWVCGPLSLIGLVRDQDNGNWGKIFEFTDHDRIEKQITILDAEFAGEALDVRRKFLAEGLAMRTDKIGRERFITALAGVRTSQRARLAFQSGWHDDAAYLLPDQSIGHSVERLVYAGPTRASYHGASGEYDAWRTGIGAAASGNAVLLFVLSCGFAAPFLRPLDGEGGGFHLRGASSCGKTTALEAAGSIWGGGGNQGFVQTWRATANAVESIAHAHNDGLLCFDEMKTLGGDVAGDAAYALATGQQKGRLTSNSDLRARLSWRVLILSSGEVSLADLIRTAKGRVYAGQELRLVDLPVEVSRVGDLWSCWQDVHGAASHAAFSGALKATALRHYGQAGPMFVQRFLDRRAAMLEAAERLRRAFLADAIEIGDTGQVHRAAERFALVAAAGELAALMDVVPWSPGEAAGAAKFMFDRWAQRFGRKRAREDLQAIREVAQFLGRFEHSRFRSVKDDLTEEQAIIEEKKDEEHSRQGEARSLDLAGWKSIKTGRGLIFHFNGEFWRSQLFQGVGWEGATKALKAAGYLITDKEPGRLTHTVRLPGGQTRKFYSVSAEILEASFDDEG